MFRRTTAVLREQRHFQTNDMYSNEMWQASLLFRSFSQNCEKRLLPSSCLSHRPSSCNNSAPTGRIPMKFDTGRFIMITNIYKNNNSSQPRENWKSFSDVRCVHHRVTRHTSIRYSSFSHTRVSMGQHGHYIHSNRLAAEMWTTMKNNKFLSCSFYLYRFRKYVSYGFPIIIFCNPGVRYETPCIQLFFDEGRENSSFITICQQ
jgi:hypothetical protein